MGAQSGQVHGGRGYRFFSTLRQISFFGEFWLELSRLRGCSMR